MGQINLARVVGGGLLAGLIMNISEYVLHAIAWDRTERGCSRSGRSWGSWETPTR